MAGNIFNTKVALSSADSVFKGLGSIIKQNRQEQKAIQKKQAFMGALESGDPNKMAEFVISNPDSRELVNDVMKYKSTASKKNHRDTLRNILTDPQNAGQYISDRKSYLESVGADTGITDKSMEMYQQNPEAFMKNAEVAFAGVAPREFKALQAGKVIQEEDEQLSEVQSSKILPGGLVQIVRKDGSTAIIPPEEAGEKLVKSAENRGAELQGLRSRERESGKRSIIKSTKLLDSTARMRKNNVNLRKASKLLTEGAETGPIIKMLPSLRASSVKLQNLQSELGLDVVGAVTFGALSKGELDLAKSVALPTGLRPLELKQWVEDKIVAQEKLATYMEDQAIFLDSGGTPASWIQNMRDEKVLSEQEQRVTEQAQPQNLPPQNQQGWGLMTDANGNKAYVGPNGEIEEVQ